MFYKVVSQFKQESDREAWRQYINFSGLTQINDFCSLDGMLNESLFMPQTVEDWHNCVNEDYKIEMITTLDYAKTVACKYPGARILGLVIDPRKAEMPANARLLGYDILDDGYSISLLTNCGGFPNLFDNSHINRYGLLDELAETYAIRNQLRRVHIDNPHAMACEVVAVFDV